MQYFFENSRAVGNMHGLDPWIFGPEYAWFWSVRPDVLGGLNRLNKAYQGHVDEVYG